MDIRKVSEVDSGRHDMVLDIIIDAFYDIKFQHFSKDRDVLKKAYFGSIDTDYLHVAMMGGEIIGVISCTPKGVSVLKVDRKTMSRHLGFFKGNLAYFLRKIMSGVPFEIDGGTGNIEFLATVSHHRGQGVGSALMRYVMEHSGYESLILDVADSNLSAIRLYERLGFIKVGQKKFLPNSDIKYIIYMQWRRS
jgi:ribosomal protein S18 acetylase RimI-like enzyme